MDIDLEEGRVYGLYSENLTYAARVWVNGELLIDQGHVSETAGDFVPKTSSVLAYFTTSFIRSSVFEHSGFSTS